MDKLNSIIQFVSSLDVLSIAGLILAALIAFVGFLHALIGIALLIPGDHPDKELQAVADVVQKWVDGLTKLSIKPKDPEAKQ